MDLRETDLKEEDRSLFYAVIHEKAVYTMHVHVSDSEHISSPSPKKKKDKT